MFDWNNPVLVVLTDLGDSAVLGAIVIVVAAYLWIARCHRTALVLAGALVAGAVGIGLLKTAFLGCGIHVGKLTIRSPSGHAGLSCAVLGTLASVMAGQLAGWRRLLPYIALVPLIATITATRVLLNYHSVSEALVGLLMGGAVAALAHVMLRREPKPVFNKRGLVLVVIAVSILLDGVRLPAEECIHLLATTVREHVPICRMSMFPVFPPSQRYRA